MLLPYAVIVPVEVHGVGVMLVLAKVVPQTIVDGIVVLVVRDIVELLPVHGLRLPQRVAEHVAEVAHLDEASLVTVIPVVAGIHRFILRTVALIRVGVAVGVSVAIAIAIVGECVEVLLVVVAV